MPYITQVTHKGIKKFVEDIANDGKVTRLTVRPDAALSREEMADAKHIRDCALHPDNMYTRVSLMYHS